MKMRQDPRMILTQKALLALWKKDKDNDDVDLAQPLSYIDRMRVRVPGNQVNLPPHVDGGSIYRWTDDLYR